MDGMPVGATFIAVYGGGRRGEILQCKLEDLLLPIDFIEPGPAPVLCCLQLHPTSTAEDGI